MTVGRRLVIGEVLAAGSELPAKLRAALARDAIVAIPTESTYGLAVLPDRPVAVESIFALKGRGEDQPLPVVVADTEQAAALGVDCTHPLWQWAAQRWPSPLTVIVPTHRELAAQRGASGLAVRIPALRPLRSLLEQLGSGVTATSANLSGRSALCSPDAVESMLRQADGWLVDAGDLPGGPPSTVVAWNARQRVPVVLRQGAYVF